MIFNAQKTVFFLWVCLLCVVFSVSVRAESAIDITESTVSKPPQDNASKWGPLENYSRDYIIDMARKGHPEAQMKLGFAYSLGRGMPRDPVQGFYWTEKAARQGNAKAQYNLSIAYNRGEGVEADKEKGQYWVEQAAKNGLPEAQRFLQVTGDAKKHMNPVPVIDEMKRKAEQGDKESAFQLAQGYLHGKGVPRDLAQWRIWNKKAAELGHAEAQFKMAYYALDDYKSHENYFYWTEKAAKNKHEKAQYNLVIYYTAQEVGLYDFRQAYAWMKTAEKGGIEIESALSEKVEQGISYMRTEAEALAADYIQKYAKQ